jgi:hypothetical protein
MNKKGWLLEGHDDWHHDLHQSSFAQGKQKITSQTFGTRTAATLKFDTPSLPHISKDVNWLYYRPRRTTVVSERTSYSSHSKETIVTEGDEALALGTFSHVADMTE